MGNGERTLKYEIEQNNRTLWCTVTFTTADGKVDCTITYDNEVTKVEGLGKADTALSLVGFRISALCNRNKHYKIKSTCPSTGEVVYRYINIDDVEKGHPHLLEMLEHCIKSPVEREAAMFHKAQAVSKHAADHRAQLQRIKDNREATIASDGNFQAAWSRQNRDAGTNVAATNLVQVTSE